MKMNQLGSTDIKVSQICLGTMTFGEQNNESEAHEQLDFAFDHGINFIDTAEMYPVPPMSHTYSKTEQFIGRWKKLHTHRDQIILATKVVGPTSMNYIRDGKPRLDRKNILEACDASLKRLNVDYIDLYQMHWPDRTTNYFGQLGYNHLENEESISIEETLSTCQELIKQGKIRHIGISNETPWGTMKYLELHRTKNLPKIESIQNPYNLLNRSFEIGLSEISHREKVGLLAYSPLAFGVLTGKYREKPWPAMARITRWERFSRYNNPMGFLATEKYFELAQASGLKLTDMALAYVNSRSFLTSNIIGATNLDQLAQNIKSVEIKLGQDVLNKIEEIHRQICNPCP